MFTNELGVLEKDHKEPSVPGGSSQGTLYMKRVREHDTGPTIANPTGELQVSYAFFVYTTKGFVTKLERFYETTTTKRDAGTWEQFREKCIKHLRGEKLCSGICCFVNIKAC